jgi:hypothetical protein
MSSRAARLLLTLALCGCEGAPVDAPQAPRAQPESPQAAEIRASLAQLRREETELRARTEFASQPPSSRALGANPYAIVALPALAGFAGILRGDSRVVLLDAQLHETSSLPTSPSPSALAVGSGSRLFVAGPLAAVVERFRIASRGLERDGGIPLPPGTVARALVADESALIVADFVGDRLLSLPGRGALSVPADGAELRRTSVCQGPLRLALSPRFLAVDCLFDHAVLVLERDASGEPGREVGRIVHDGPLWSIALHEIGDELFVATGGVEDHPLVRRDRVFGYIDSFVHLYALDRRGALERREAWNVAELGVVTPTVLTLDAQNGAPRVEALGYGSARAVTLRPGTPPLVREAPPGCSDFALLDDRRVCASPLFDAWVELGEKSSFVPVRAPRPGDPPPLDRLGEALFFTTLMAPDASSEGRLSRFTCETCHFEGATDGRVHHSGRNEIRVSTRSLFGLFNAAPYFSRARDPDLTSVCHHEFAVANRGNPVDPWFSLDAARAPWLAALGLRAPRFSPAELRRALLGFFARFSPEENPFVEQRPAPARFTEEERLGAELFRQHCASCHAPRLVASAVASAVPFERWESLIFSPATPLVWAHGGYEQTGILPYVDPEGTRVPSLRRLYLKRPYFTNGSARSLADVLERARVGARFFHAEAAGHPSDSRTLARDEQSALLAFLRLL